MADRIIVDFQALDRISGRLNAAGRELDQAMSQLARLHVTRDAGANVSISGCGTRLQTVDMAVSARTVSAAVSSYQNAVGSLSSYTSRLGAAVQRVSDLFEKTENSLSGKMLDTGESAPTTEGVMSELSESSWWDFLLKYFQDVKDEEDLLSAIKSILKGYDSWGNVGEAGVIENVVSYIESLAGFFLGDKMGLTGARDLCDLTNSSVEVWSGLYDYYCDMFDGVTKGFFGDVAQRNVKILGLTGGLIGLTGSILSAKSGIDEKAWQSIWADYIDCGKDVFSVIKSGYALKHIGDAQSLAKIKAGVWSALNVYSAVGDSLVRSVSQGFRSHEKYSADGQWDLGDTGATGVDIAMAGIYGISHSLTLGLDDLIFGAIDRATGGNGNSDMSYFEKAAEGYKFLAKKCGEAIGNWWLKLTRK